VPWDSPFLSKLDEFEKAPPKIMEMLLKKEIGTAKGILCGILL
jgi:hypothetical protein